MRNAVLLFKARQLEARGTFDSHFSQRNANVGGRVEPVFSISELADLRSKLASAVSLPAIGPLATEISDSAPLQMLSASINIDRIEYVRLRTLAGNIDTSLAALIRVLDSLDDGSTQENEVSVRLPGSQQLATVTETLSRIDKILSQALAVLPEPPTVTVQRWENGSLWVDLLVGSVSGVVFIGGLAWSAACAFKKLQEGRLVEKMVQSLGIKNEMLTVIQERIDEAVGEVIEAEARRLDAKHSKSKGDSETIQRLQYCIRELYEMVRSGTEIHPSLVAPEEVKNVFPNLEETLGLPSTIKMLTERSENDESSDQQSQ